MFVENGTAQSGVRPVERVARSRHGAGQRGAFFAIQSAEEHRHGESRRLRFGDGSARQALNEKIDFLGAQPAAQDSLTNRYDNTRAGATLIERTLTTANVNTGKFGKLWTLYADGQIVAQPLYVSGLRVDTEGELPSRG